MESPFAWTAPPQELRLQENEIHLWRATLDCEAAALRRFEGTLAPEEKARAAKFVFPRDRDHFIAARGILRELLGNYLGRDPQSVDFAYGAQGKPRLGGPDSGRPVRFNLSHSHGLAVYALTLEREVGVDLEPIRPDFATHDIAERFFSVEEVAELQALPQALRPEGFFLCWTRKEAYIKARGEGLGIPLDSFRVSLTPGEREILTSADSGRWTLRAFQPAEGFAGAVVAEGSGWQLRPWQWKGDWNVEAGGAKSEARD